MTSAHLRPSFSIIIACFNAEKTIKATLDSILTQLELNDEIIIVDDFSTDNSVKIIREYTDPRIIFIQHKRNMGMCKTRNTGISVAKNHYIAFTDCDDIWPINRQKIILEIFSQHYLPLAISGQVEHFICPSLPEEMAIKFSLPPIQSAMLPGTVIFHHTLINKAVKFDETLFYGEFLDFISRMRVQGKDWCKINSILLLRRIHGMNYSIQFKQHQNDYLKAVRAHLNRK